MVDANNRRCYGCGIPALELEGLIPEAGNYAVDLFYHRCCDDLDLNADLNICGWSHTDEEVRFPDSRHSWQSLSECPVTSPDSDTSYSIRNIDYAFNIVDTLL